MSSTKPQLKRTYGSHSLRRTHSATSQSSDVTEISSPRRDPESTSVKRKRPLLDAYINCAPTSKKICNKKSDKLKKGRRTLNEQETLKQLHFITEKSTLRTCKLCDLTYTCGALDDEALHKTHCARVQRGLEWGKEEDRALARKDENASIVSEDIDMPDGGHGRIVVVKPGSGGRIGAKIKGYLDTVNLALSAPELPAATLESAKVYLFLLRERGCSKERMVGCVVATRIVSAMNVTSAEEAKLLRDSSTPPIHVEGDLYCKPERVPTPMGIPRLFVACAHRRKGIAKLLLSTATKTFIHGCELNPKDGEVAFSQPTSMGRKVMEDWGRGGVRIYEE